MLARAADFSTEGERGWVLVSKNLTCPSRTEREESFIDYPPKKSGDAAMRSSIHTYENTPMQTRTSEGHVT